MQIKSKKAENVSVWQTNLIKIYCAARDNSSTIEAIKQRQSNNFRYWLNIIGVDFCEHMEYIVDSCPIILAKGSSSRHAGIVRELCKKSYNSSRKEWCYGLKLRADVARRLDRLPVLLPLMASGTAMHNLAAAKQLLNILRVGQGGRVPDRKQE